MKRFSKVALAAALLTGASAIGVSSPVFAKDKPQQPTGPQFSNKEALDAFNAAKEQVVAKNAAAAEPLVAQAEALAKTDDERYYAALLRVDLEQQKVDAARAAKQQPDQTRLTAAANVLLASQFTPQATKAGLAANLGVIYFNSRQFKQAATYFEQAQQLGSTEPNLAANIVKARMASGDAAGSLAELTMLVDTQTQQKGKADEELYRFAISKTIAAKDGAGTLSWMRRYLAAYPTPKNWRDMVKIYGLQQGSFITTTNAQSLDLFRLLRATNALDQYDYEAYADRANKVGLPYETRTVITEGRSKGKIPAGGAQQLLTTATNAISMEGSLSQFEAKAKASADGKLAAQTGDAQLGSGNWAKAAELYRVALQKGGANTNDVNLRLGIALAMTGDKAGAKTALAAVQGAPSADIAALWSTYVDLGAPTAA